MDRIWGIGLAEDDPKAWNKKSWRGKNLLGEVLTRVRDKLMGSNPGSANPPEPEKGTDKDNDKLIGMDAKTAQVVVAKTAQVAVGKTTQLLSPQQQKLMGSNPGPANPSKPEKGAIKDNE